MTKIRHTNLADAICNEIGKAELKVLGREKLIYSTKGALYKNKIVLSKRTLYTNSM